MHIEEMIELENHQKMLKLMRRTLINNIVSSIFPQITDKLQREKQ